MCGVYNGASEQKTTCVIGVNYYESRSIKEGYFNSYESVTREYMVTIYSLVSPSDLVTWVLLLVLLS